MLYTFELFCISCGRVCPRCQGLIRTRLWLVSPACLTHVFVQTFVLCPPGWLTSTLERFSQPERSPASLLHFQSLRGYQDFSGVSLRAIMASWSLQFAIMYLSLAFSHAPSFPLLVSSARSDSSDSFAIFGVANCSQSGLLDFDRFADIRSSCQGCDWEPCCLSSDVFLHARLERTYQWCDSSLGDSLPGGCDWQAYGWHHQGQWYDPWDQSGQRVQQERHVGNCCRSSWPPRGCYTGIGWFAAKVRTSLQGQRDSRVQGIRESKF